MVVIPNKPVTVRRWEVVAMFIIVIAAAAGSVQWSNHNIDKRIDAAEKRITMNTATNVRQEKLERQRELDRKENRSRFKRTDVLACREIEKLKEGFRTQAQENFRELDENAALLGIVVTPDLRKKALEERNETLARYAPRVGGCGTVPSARPSVGG